MYKIYYASHEYHCWEMVFFLDYFSLYHPMNVWQHQCQEFLMLLYKLQNQQLGCMLKSTFDAKDDYSRQNCLRYPIWVHHFQKGKFCDWNPYTNSKNVSILSFSSPLDKPENIFDNRTHLISIIELGVVK